MKSYGVKHNMLEVRARSRSGGAFIAITDFVLEKKGIVYGCKMQNNEIAVHWKAETPEDRDEFCGSKYIQSDMCFFEKHIFDDVVTQLINKRWVAFSGTPCQIRALYNFLKIKDIQTETLVLIDIACHGVPSPKIWKDYLEWISKKYQKNVRNVNFRDKSRFGWAAHWETFEFDKFFVYSKLFRELFYRHYILRPSCYACRCKKMPYPSDFTLADFWGCKELYDGFDDDLGVSLVFVNSSKAGDIFTKIQNRMQTVECELDKVIQPTLIHSVNCPDDRQDFWNVYKKEGIAKAINEFAGRTKKNYILEYLPNRIVTMLRREKSIGKVKK